MRATQQPAPVVVAVDGSERSAGAVRYAVREARTRKRTVRLVKSAVPDGEVLARAFSMASARHTALRLVHVVEVPELAAEIGVAGAYADESLSSGRRMLETAAREWRDAFPDVPVETSAVEGRPADALVDASADADLLMLARPHRDLRHPVRLGRTPRAVLGVSDTPVEVVPLKREPATAPLVLESEGEILKS